MMKKKVKKIPKYNAGGSVLDTILKNNQLVAPSFNPQNNGVSSATAGTIAAGKTWSNMNNTQRTGAIVDASGVVLNGIGNIGKPATLSGAIQGGLSGASAGAAIGGPLGAGIGFAAGTLFNGIGNKASTDGYGNYKKSTGITRLLGIGKSDSEIIRQANIEKNSMISQQQTQAIQSDYYNNPNVTLQPTTAAEGGIMRQPVDALVSKGELIYNPMTKKLSKVPGSKGKPNKADDVYARLYEGDVVISNSPTMLMANGKTPAQNLEGLVDKYATGGTVKAREAIIKKVVNWQEANKTKPQEYAMYEDGTGKDGVQSGQTKKIKVRKKEPLKVYEWMGKTGYFTADGGFTELPPNPATWPDSVYMGRYEYIDAPVDKYVTSSANNTDEPSNIGVTTNNELNFNSFRHTRDGINDKDIIRANGSRRTPTQDEINAFYGYDREKVVETERKDRNEKINNKNRRYKVDGNDLYDMGDLQEVTVTAPKKVKNTNKNAVSKPSSGKKTTASRVATSTTPSPEYTVIRRPERVYDYEEPAKAVATPTDNTKIYGRDGSVRYDYNIPERKVTPADLGRDVADAGNDNYTGSDWRGNLYRMMVLTQPFWDKTTAEPVNYESPVYKYMPTQIDVTSQFRDTDQSYALAKYNFANLYPNTGAGMAAGLQAAANRAKQYADIRQYQTNAQNELIGKNVGIYNNWANEHARIMNDVYNKTAANRAAARNINRQNRAAALSNYGQMLRDDKQYAMDTLKINMLEPLLAYGTENSDTIVKKARNILSGNYGKLV